MRALQRSEAGAHGHERSVRSVRAGGARLRRRRVLGAVCALTACPTLIAGLYGTGAYGSAYYGFAGVVLAICLLWFAEVLGRFMP